MSSASKSNDESIDDRLADAFEDRLGPDESVGDMTVEEFGEALRDAGFMTKDELVAAFVGGGSPPTGGGDGSEVFGAGIAGDNGETPVPPAETHAAIEANMRGSSDPEDYSTGVQATDSDRSADLPTDTPLDKLTGSAAGPTSAVDSDEHPLEAYGTGVAGDTSAAEHRRREEQADILARAMEKADTRDGGEE
jgi:hypothetical protein